MEPDHFHPAGGQHRCGRNEITFALRAALLVRLGQVVRVPATAAPAGPAYDFALRRLTGPQAIKE
jgi:hypothetical protein